MVTSVAFIVFAPPGGGFAGIEGVLARIVGRAALLRADLP